MIAGASADCWVLSEPFDQVAQRNTPPARSGATDLDPLDGREPGRCGLSSAKLTLRHAKENEQSFVADPTARRGRRQRAAVSAAGGGR